MNSAAVPELDGARLHVPGAPEVWLVFHGSRHHVVSPAVYDALFSEPAGLIAMESVDHIQRGADLSDGTCLVRPESESAIFLVTGFPATEVRKHYIPSYETFLAFSFDESKVRDVPDLVLAGVPTGRDLRSAT